MTDRSQGTNVLLGTAVDKDSDLGQMLERPMLEGSDIRRQSSMSRSSTTLRSEDTWNLSQTRRKVMETFLGGRAQ